jgi:hypothetical protein
MFQLLMKIVAIVTKTFVYNRFCMKETIITFVTYKHKKIEMQKHKDNDNINVKCRYCN